MTSCKTDLENAGLSMIVYKHHWTNSQRLLQRPLDKVKLQMYFNGYIHTGSQKVVFTCVYGCKSYTKDILQIFQVFRKRWWLWSASDVSTITGSLILIIIWPTELVIVNLVVKEGPCVLRRTRYLTGKWKWPNLVTFILESSPVHWALRCPMTLQELSTESQRRTNICKQIDIKVRIRL